MASSAVQSASSAMAASIPRFLLPRRGSLWQQHPRLPTISPSPSQLSLPGRATHCLRQASTSVGGRRGAPTSPSSRSSVPAGNVLEKPAKFNPPSHGTRLPRKGANRPGPASLHYGGDLSAAERQAQRQRQYPGVMAPPGTWSHWFWNSRAFHLTLTMATLTALGLATFFENVRRTSPFADLLPSAEEARAHPVQALQTALEVVRLTEAHKATLIAERRQQRIDDVAKRTAYRKAHGLDETVGFGSTGSSIGDSAVGTTLRKWFGSGSSAADAAGATAAGSGNADSSTGLLTEPDVPSGTARARATSNYDDASPIRGAAPPAPAAEEAEAGKRKKFLGLF